MSVLQTEFVGRITLMREQLQDVSVYPFNLPALKEFDQLKPHPKVTFFVGENGSGKSTLLEALAVSLGMNAEGGTENFRFGTRASHSCLHEYLRIAKGFKRPQTKFFLRAESYFNLATEIENLDAAPASGPPIINSYGYRSLHEQSHGESFMALMMNRFGKNGLYLLDEPEAALSPQRQLVALSRMHELVQEGSQFIIATHSPILMAYPDAVTYEFSAKGIAAVKYEETSHFQITKNFLMNPERMLDILMADASKNASASSPC
ncbi:AAA family ATPase [Variovorax sp. PCZ-1]|uniref:AAA family ATPase n=1 Tax=Variovorax sp. PCZ-1 TaxID=2835533 RepID=UPI001BCB27EB|nr:AAA family ATPase [Variovorax sp. PCZ-1]MBS7807267.1 AAA family ATPase [Variovorax sp. PCZ-1]